MNRILHFSTTMAIVLALSGLVSVNAATRHNEANTGSNHSHYNGHKTPKHNDNHRTHQWQPDVRHSKTVQPQKTHNHPIVSSPKPHAPQHKHHQAPFRRPTPPPRFRPAYNLVDGILGITLGTALNVSVNYLNANGYSIGARSSNHIGLTNVMEMNMMWPVANLYYSASGLSASEFIHYSASPNTARYNRLYHGLNTRYGAPASINRTNNGMISASWFGYDNQFVTLTYQPSVDNHGIPTYLTSLIIGN